MAAQLGSRPPLVAAGRRAVSTIETQTGMAGYVAVPCYADVLVIAASGEVHMGAFSQGTRRADAGGPSTNEENPRLP
jgi:hypothetical protein